MRVHELAKELKISSKELINILQKQGVDAKSHMTSLDDNAMSQVKQKKAPAATKPAAISTPAPAKTSPVKAASLKKEKKAPAREIKPSRKTAPKAAPQETPKAAPEEVPKEAPKPAEIKPEKPLQAKPVEVKVAVKDDPKVAAPTAVADAIRIEFPVTVGTLASRLNLRVSDVIKTLMGLGVFANVNQSLSEEIAFKLASQLGVAIEGVAEEEKKQKGGKLTAEESKNAKHRPPVVTMMGHVDHGKTSLLDAIRKTNVVSREAGRITQHIGAYVVDLPGKGHVTFLDTPGHEAFTAMRARGANATDVVVLVVAADDGVMPQTVEAIDHAKEAGVPIIVAVNKCDLPAANAQKVMVQLQKMDLVAEEWGGKTIFCKVSAKTGEGIDHLLEMLLLEAEILELKGNRDLPAEGVVIESRITKGSGPVATVIVQKGTLRIGDIVMAGPYYGKVKALQNDLGKRIQGVLPGYAAEVHGLSGSPEAGEIIRVAQDERSAREVAGKKLIEKREKTRRGTAKHLSLEDLHAKIKEGSVKELKLVIKADVQGSVEVLTQSLERLSTNAVRLHVIHGGVGAPNESDVMLAAASDAIVIGFHLKPEPRVVQLSEEEGIDIRCYDIIYEAVDDVRKAMEGLLEPVYHEAFEGRADIRQVFRSSKSGNVGGASVTKGKIMRASKVRLLRNKTVLFDGKLGSLKRFKDDIKEVAEGFEFGFVLEGFSAIQEGDILEAYHIEKGPSPKLK